MKVLSILLIAFVIALAAIGIIGGEFDYSLAGRIAMSVMLIFTALGHVVYLKGMILMMPDIFPFKKEIVYATGVIELAAAIGLLIPQVQHLTAWLLIIFFIAILPANINSALKHVDFQKGTTDGNGANYLWFRIPLQIFFIAWVYFFAIWS